jgi:hypothetical protein
MTYNWRARAAVEEMAVWMSAYVMMTAEREITTPRAESMALGRRERYELL